MTAAAVRPRAHWFVLGLGAFVLLAALVLEGFSDQHVGGAGTGPPTKGKASVAGGAAVLYREDGRLTSRGLPARTVALTFDDGPDPRWTPEVLEMLRREAVPATFFDVGSRAAQHPELLRRTIAAGHEIGLHSWTHADLTRTPPWLRSLELSMNQLGVEGVGGISTHWVRPPYSSTPDALRPADVQLADELTSRGYIEVLSDRDSEDWRRPGVARVVANAPPQGDAGAVLLFHDGGGDRSQTVAALPQVIGQLRARGYRFTTLSEGLALPVGAVVPASTARHAQGLALLGSVGAARWVASAITWSLLPLGLLALLRTLLLVGLARRHVAVATGRSGTGGPWLPPVSVIVPAYQEAVGIAAAVRSLAASRHPGVEVIVVDDGSTDGTARIVEDLALPNVVVVRQRNAGKPAALNTGLRHSSAQIVVMVDGDTVFEPDTITELVQPLRDPAVGAVSGNTKVGNRNRVLGRWQHLEYVVGFNLDRRMYDLLRCMPTIPGAIGAFRRSVLEQVGGVSGDTLAEDTDLTMAINRAGHRVVYAERARAWTEAPSTLSALWRQRYRWCYGTLQASWKHRRAVVEPGPGRRLGRVGLPYLLAFQVLLPLLAPVVDVFALYGLLFLDVRRVAFAWLGFLALQGFSAAYALRLDGEPLGPLWTLPLQQFVYRQLMYLVVLQSVASAVSGTRLRWHKLARTGDVVVGGT
ncbi:MAG: glycosyltransferase [Mycobacteriales bacterium]